MKELKWILIIMGLAGGVYLAADHYIHTEANGRRLVYDPEDEVEEDLAEYLSGRSVP